MPEFTGTNDLRTYLRILWRWKWLFLFFVVVTPVAAYLIERGQTRTYRSAALVGVNEATVDTSLLPGGGSFSTSNVTAISQLVTTASVADIAAGLLHPPGDPSQIVSEVSATADPITNFLTISAEDRSPRRAADIANAFARAITLNRRNAAIAELNNAIAGLRTQTKHLSHTNPTRSQLEQQLNQLRAARSTQGSDAAILQAATPSATPTGLRTRRAVELGLLLGVLLGFGAVVLAESADRRLRSPGDLETMTDLPLLASIPPSAFSSELDTSKEDEEAFHTLRTALVTFNLDRSLRSILVTSPRERDGKTTVATRLALASAAGGMRIILIDGDLRRAQVSPRLGIDREDGLAAILAGERSLDDLLVEYPIPSPAAGRLEVLPAGSPLPDPAAVIGSEAMGRVLSEIETRCDLAIIDTPAALAVSDALPLMRQVSGVVIVARMNWSGRDTVARLQRVVEAAGGTPVGVVATGVTATLGYGYYSPKYYTQTGANGSKERRRTGALNRDVGGSPEPRPPE